MKIFDELLEIIQTLLGPQGCPWDQVQTLASLRPYLLEETSEVVEAIDLGNEEHMQDEFADLFFNALFLCAVAQKETSLTLDTILTHLKNKLIRRHPHVFGDAHIDSKHALEVQWEQIKQEEKRHNASPATLPESLPTLQKAQKLLKKHPELQQRLLENKDHNTRESEQQLGEHLLHIVSQAQHQGIDAETALRSTLTKLFSKEVY